MTQSASSRSRSRGMSIRMCSAFSLRTRGVPLVVHDVARDPRYLRGPLADAASALAVPVRSGEGAVGVLDVEADRPWAFDALDLEGFGALASALGRVLARTPPLPAPPPR